ncbi:threonyl-tRNA synthetase [Sorangium cellulosum]|uniref:Threonine--tRNA ligase n=1 Tax=Sorangium cellulosum TaxID=56 RepID=A0A4P2Q7U3_SORCE|nr:threonine--tRNA ligase [Sorangium cellulosum]AUX25246.1 threonyl-tRNA synthetase [Sorangium cellulosum]
MLDDDDHRTLGQRLDLFHFQEEAPGMVFWHARGFTLYRVLEEAVRRQMMRDSYREVRTPQILRQAIWKASGHWDNFSSNMFRLSEEEHAAAIKPVSCPGHMQIVARMAPSYRDLPLRIGEFGLVHRDEPSGTLHGLFRLRQFTQDDGHIFCTEEQVEPEVVRFASALRDFYAGFGFEDMVVGFSTRPAERAGSDAAWDRAEAALSAAARSAGLDCKEQPGEGAFYGPKLEFVLRDRLGRSWQCGTIQLDFVLPERFDITYVDASGARRRPAVLHRALLGSLERFLGVLLEQSRGALPPWLSPEQVVVVPVAEAQRAYAEEVLLRLQQKGVRAILDAGDETLSRKIALAHAAAIPLVAVVGKREAERRAVALREREGGRQRELPLDEAVHEVARRCERHA